jgi:hypothetical protein
MLIFVYAAACDCSFPTRRPWPWRLMAIKPAARPRWSARCSSVWPQSRRAVGALSSGAGLPMVIVIVIGVCGTSAFLFYHSLVRARVLAVATKGM